MVSRTVDLSIDEALTAELALYLVLVEADEIKDGYSKPTARELHEATIQAMKELRQRLRCHLEQLAEQNVRKILEALKGEEPKSK